MKHSEWSLEPQVAVLWPLSEGMILVKTQVLPSIDIYIYRDIYLYIHKDISPSRRQQAYQKALQKCSCKIKRKISASNTEHLLCAVHSTGTCTLQCDIHGRGLPFRQRDWVRASAISKQQLHRIWLSGHWTRQWKWKEVVTIEKWSQLVLILNWI